MPRTVRIFRYDPERPDEGHFDTFQLEIPSETTTTILDVLLRLQQEQDATLSFRFACRVNMCGSCGMVIDGREGLACKTNVSDIADGKEITIRPLNHFPVIKDLVVNMAPFFRQYDGILPFFQPKPGADEPARIAPQSAERLAIAGATECIACGCCVSSCTMVNDHADYAGPAALNRAFTLIADSRDALHDERLDRALASCYECRTEFNCTEVCPKGISPTRAIKYIQREALTHPGARARSWRAWLPVFMAAAVSFAVLGIYVMMTRVAEARQSDLEIAVPDRVLTASEAHGARLYASLGCSGCHQIEGRAGKRIGPDLSNIAAKKRSREEIVRFIQSPGAAAMPPYPLPDADLRALADFVLAVGTSPLKTIPEEVLKHE